MTYTEALNAAKVLIAMDVKPFIAAVQSAGTAFREILNTLDGLTPQGPAEQRRIEKHLARCAHRRDRRRMRG